MIKLKMQKEARLRAQPGFTFFIILSFYQIEYLFYLIFYLNPNILIHLRNILEIFLNLLVTNLVILQISIEIALVGWHINQAMT